MKSICLLVKILFFFAMHPRVVLAEQHVGELDDVVIVIKTGPDNLQKSPIAVTTFNEQQIGQSGASSTFDLLHQIPNMAATENMSHGSIHLRGVGTSNIFVGSDPSVTVHYDGVYLGRFLESFKDFLSVEQVEVLRGPQGTLYGRNSIGGTINLKTHLPNNLFSSKIMAEMGNREHKKFNARVSGPLIEEKLFASFTIMGVKGDGYLENENTLGSSDLGDEDKKGLEGKLRWLINDGTELILHADHMDVDENGHPYKQTYLLDNGTYNIAGATVPNSDFKVNIPYDFKDNYKNTGSYAKYIQQINPSLKLTSITAFRDSDYNTSLDADYSDVNLFVADIAENQNQFTQEFQLNGKQADLEWVGGLFYFNEHNRLNETFSFMGMDMAFTHKVDTKAYAIYLQGSYAVHNKLSFTAGARYSYEEKQMQGSLPLLGFSTRQKEHWNGITPKFGVDYQLDNNTLLFANISKGFKSGGFNVVLNNPSPDLSFEPEYLWSYEVGLKVERLQRKLRLNSSIFHYDYQDMQVAHLLPGAIIDIDNAAKAEVNGVELELAYHPNPRWRLDGSFAWLDARYRNHTYSPDGISQMDVSDNRLNASPEFTVNATLQYYQPIDSGKLTYRFNYYWQDEEFYTAQNSAYSKQDSYYLLDASLGFQTHDEQWNIILYGKNLTDEAYFNVTYNFAAPVGIFGKLNPGRTYGVRAIYHF